MIRILLPVILLLLGLGAGVGAGMFLASPGETETAAPEPSPEATTPGTGRAPDQTAPRGPTEFVRLNNQFIVPIVRNGAVRSLIVMSLTIEVDAGTNQSVFSQEPRLRDSFLQVMFAHANSGGFEGSFTQANSMDPLRTGLRDAARQILGASAHDVLIIDIMRQDA